MGTIKSKLPDERPRIVHDNLNDIEKEEGGLQICNDLCNKGKQLSSVTTYSERFFSRASHRIIKNHLTR